MPFSAVYYLHKTKCVLVKRHGLDSLPSDLDTILANDNGHRTTKFNPSCSSFNYCKESTLPQAPTTTSMREGAPKTHIPR